MHRVPAASCRKDGGTDGARRHGSGGATHRRDGTGRDTDGMGHIHRRDRTDAVTCRFIAVRVCVVGFVLRALNAAVAIVGQRGKITKTLVCLQCFNVI